MTLTTLTQSHSPSPSPSISNFKYSLIFSDEAGDTEETIAIFGSLPTSQDWQPWLENWAVLGYTLQGEPRLISAP